MLDSEENRHNHLANKALLRVLKYILDIKREKEKEMKTKLRRLYELLGSSFCEPFLQ